MPQVRITAPDLTGPNPAWIVWNELPGLEKAKTPAPVFELPVPIGTLIDCTANEAEILVGKKFAELVTAEAPVTADTP